ncbi:MAG TPA: SRPBCC domain-containing protein [Polyangiaceae bacterium]|nr:SRPBCC domain-containing protein [Polyangiaceae bacterium]
MTKKQITLERTFDATLEEVWEMWTTQEGIESWWGPNGFVVKVRKIDLRPGGELQYAMTAVGADEIAFIKKSGMPLTGEHRLTYTEIVPLSGSSTPTRSTSFRASTRTTWGPWSSSTPSRKVCAWS